MAAVLGALCLANLAFFWWYYPRPAAETHAVRLTIEPPQQGIVSTLSVSPDGRRVVYGAPNADGNKILWLRSLDFLSAQPLPGTDNPFFTTFWSPDSRHVAFVSSSDNKLKKVDLASGGAPQVLANAPNGRGGTWNRDGVIVFAPSAAGPLYRISAAGGEITPVTTIDESRRDVSHRYPWFLPDGRHFLYLVRGAAGDDTAIYVGSLDSKETKRLVTAQSGGIYSPPGYLLYVRDETLVAHTFDAETLELKGEALSIAGASVGFDLTSNLRGSPFPIMACSCITAALNLTKRNCSGSIERENRRVHSEVLQVIAIFASLRMRSVSPSGDMTRGRVGISG
ncbi:MAG: hypothetical protein LC794_02215 [Acidobacteria bacterium]|nr:hypothetical protein [Acidobacteriota bacterium]